MPLRFRRLSGYSIREIIAQGHLPELDYGLLKKYGEKLRWKVDDRSLFCNMVVDVLEAKQDEMTLKVIVRSLCHARDVVSDFLQQHERFNTKKSILVLGDVGMVPEPWANLIQPALAMHAKGFNIITLEIPEFMHSTPRYLKYGPAVVSGVLKFLSVNSACSLVCGNGAALMFETLAQSRHLFGPSHFIFNPDCPPGTKKAPYPLVRLEEHFRDGNLQFWVGLNDEEDIYNHFDRGTPGKAFEALSGMQVRLEGERRRGRRALDYDEVLLTEALGGSPKAPNVKRVVIGRNYCIAYSDVLLESLWRFFVAHGPSQTQDSLVNGLVPDMKMFGQMKPGEPLPVLPAMETLRILQEAGPDVLELARGSSAGSMVSRAFTPDALGDRSLSGVGDRFGAMATSSSFGILVTRSGSAASLTGRSPAGSRGGTAQSGGFRASGGSLRGSGSLRTAGEGSVKGPGMLVQLAMDARARPLPLAAPSEAYLRDRKAVWDGMDDDADLEE